MTHDDLIEAMAREIARHRSSGSSTTQIARAALAALVERAGVTREFIGIVASDVDEAACFYALSVEGDAFSRTAALLRALVPGDG